MNSNRHINVLVVKKEGSWIAACKEFEITGIGETKKDALEALQKSLFSTVRTRIQQALKSADDEGEQHLTPKRYPLNAPVAA